MLLDRDSNQFYYTNWSQSAFGGKYLTSHQTLRSTYRGMTRVESPEQLQCYDLAALLMARAGFIVDITNWGKWPIIIIRRQQRKLPASELSEWRKSAGVASGERLNDLLLRYVIYELPTNQETFKEMTELLHQDFGRPNPFKSDTQWAT
jgi:hypothetical protein